LASFHPIRVLGDGGFGRVLLAEKKSLDGARELYALKMLKKTRVSASKVTTEKEVLILTSGHPFITTLHSCFQTKVIFNFLDLLYIFKVINTESYQQYEKLVIFLYICVPWYWPVVIVMFLVTLDYTVL
jgi:serine/threonine protein kinase